MVMVIFKAFPNRFEMIITSVGAIKDDRKPFTIKLSIPTSQVEQRRGGQV